MRPRGPRALAAALLLATAGCLPEPTDLTVPTAEEVEAYYDYAPGVEVEVVGNVATVHVQQDPWQLRRGGTLWAKVGPYIFLFSDGTRELFEDYPGLAGVRFVTHVGQAEVASALLARSELTDVLWRRSLNIAGRARRDGTEQVTLLEDLVRWGEARTEFEYNPRFTNR